MKNKKLFIFITAVLLAAVCVGTLGYIYADKIHAKEEMTAIQESAYNGTRDLVISAAEATTQIKTEAAKESSTAEAEIATEAATEASTVVAAKEITTSPVDIPKLQNTNKDIFAWVSIPGTTLDYPIAKHPTDDSYYLKHGADGMYSTYGCPFVELSDEQPFVEFNTVIYGHNMNDGSMFAPLHKFEDKTFFDEHRQLYIYTADHVYSYRIFAAVMYSDARIPFYYDDHIESSRTAFLDSLHTDIVKERSIIADDTEVSEEKCIVTLSTCDKKLRDKRFLLVAVLEKIDGRDA